MIDACNDSNNASKQTQYRLQLHDTNMNSNNNDTKNNDNINNNELSD